MGLKQIKRALVSVYHKEGLEAIAGRLQALNIEIISTGGTKKYIEELDIPVRAVEEETDYPPIFGGRVKTLHPKVFGGILVRRGEAGDAEQMKEHAIEPIDLVIVDLYPFEDTVRQGSGEQEIIEKIDIGGISLIRAAAKNYEDVVIISHRGQYQSLLDILEGNKAETTRKQRRKLAAEAFHISSHYDTTIFNYFNGEEKTPFFKLSQSGMKELRYGENPHQKGVFFGNTEQLFDQLHGKEISYNNLLDVEAAIQLIADFTEPTIAIIKHNNACGLASRENLTDAWKDALAGDPVSAFGGIIISNRTIQEATAVEINKIFSEVVIAPAFDSIALEILKQKRNRIILIQKEIELPAQQYRSLLNGMLWQERDRKVETRDDLEVVTRNLPDDLQIRDMLFANKIVKHSKSNAIVLAKDGQLLGSGSGETSRVDALKHAVEKAKLFGLDLNGAVMASDAFFPFADSVEIAHKAGIRSVIQPGGSIRDKESVTFCDEHDMTMVFTGIRHFKH